MMSEKKLNFLILIFLFLVPLFSMLLNDIYITTLFSKIVILAIAGIGLNLILGYGGMVSFGHAAFFGLGGYVTGILAFHFNNYEPIQILVFEFEGTNQLLFIWIFTLIFSSILALFIGYFSLRTTGVYFIMITLAFAQMLYYFSISWPTYGGEDGLSLSLRNQIPFLNTMDSTTFFYICYVWLIITIILVKFILNSPLGISLKASKENEDRVRSVGINPKKVKLISFIISGAITGLAGSLYADLNRFVSPTILSWQMSGEIMILVILGGMFRLYGPILGAFFYIILEQFLGGITENWQFWLGFIILLEVLYAKAGIMSFLIKDKYDEKTSS
jgi:branched-chain amino acid transport system permease protein